MLNKPSASTVEAPTQTTPKQAEPSHQALQYVSPRDIRFAQTALKQLGYRIGRVDGIWGDRSAAAMLAFEQSRQLRSANGAISELNLYSLSRETKVRAKDIELSMQQDKSLLSKIDRSEPLANAPQLIIVEQSYPVLAKANPYSKVLSTIAPGTGVYVLSIQDGWFEIESLQRVKGYIREN